MRNLRNHLRPGLSMTGPMTSLFIFTLATAAACGSSGKPTSDSSASDPPQAVALVESRYSDCLTALHADLSTARTVDVGGSAVAINAGGTVLLFNVRGTNPAGQPYTSAADRTTTDELASVGC